VVFSGYSSTNITDHHDIGKILLKVVLSTIKPNQTKTEKFLIWRQTTITHSLKQGEKKKRVGKYNK